MNRNSMWPSNGWSSCAVNQSSPIVKRRLCSAAFVRCVAMVCCATAVGGWSAAAADAPATATEQLRALELTDVDGQTHRPFAEEAVQAAVLVFVSVDCPVANAFQPALGDIESEYARRGIRFFQVHCSPQTKPERVKQHRSDFKIATPVVLDQGQSTARLVAARVTPEAVVIDRSGRVRYRGLINNLYAGFGKKRRQATAHYLTDALDAMLSGQTVETPVTKPVGCFIHYEDSD